jgi:perosamine synthetase
MMAQDPAPGPRPRWPEGVDVRIWHRYFGSDFGEEEAAALREVLQQEHQTNGPQNRAFQAEFARFSGAAHAFTTSSCTTALMLAARLCGLRPGDEVVTTPLTFASTSQAVLSCGATPIFADVDPRTFNLDPASVEARLTPRTRAIFAVHLYGQCCDMDAIGEIARRRELRVIADAAHVVGGAYNGRPAGALGDAVAFSFHSSKNMTTLGEGGMLTTARDDWAAKVPLLRSMGVSYDIVHPNPLDYWLPLPYDVDDPDGYIPDNYRMSEAQAAVGRIQLRKVAALNARRQALAHRYTRGLGAVPGLVVPYEDPRSAHTHYLYALQVDETQVPFGRDDLMRILFRESGIHTITGYPPVYWFTLFQKRGYTRGLCPVAERVYGRWLLLPLYARMTDAEADYVIESVVRAASRLARGGSATKGGRP